jgi:hypothetical protein
MSSHVQRQAGFLQLGSREQPEESKCDFAKINNAKYGDGKFLIDLTRFDQQTFFVPLIKR